MSINKFPNYKSTFFRCILILFFISLSYPPHSIHAHQTGSIQTIDLDLSLDDISQVEFGYHHSSFQSQHIEYKLNVEEHALTDGKISAPLYSLSSVLSGLRGMYPGTRPLYWQEWTDDYPHAWIYLYLKDGQVIAISSDSQFDGMYPWNILVWENEKDITPSASYIQLDQNFINGVDTLWRGVGENGFPRSWGDKSSLEWIYEDKFPETIWFYNEDNADSAFIKEKGPDSLSLFIPLLIQNPEIKSLLDAGYTVYDASLSLEVEFETLKPLQYNGTLALSTPDKRDVVIGLVTLPLNDQERVKTTFSLKKSVQLVNERRESPFLIDAESILNSLTFLLDTREKDYKSPTLDCPANTDVSLNGEIIQAVWNSAEPTMLAFVPLTNQRWSVSFGMSRESANWNDDTAQKVLKAWFPENIASLPIQNISKFQTNWGISFLQDVTLRDPQLLERLKANLPQETKVHQQNPEKDGDYGFLSLDGRIVVEEDGSNPTIVYCGVTLPDWYGPEYPIEDVVHPNEQAPRQNITLETSVNDEWNTLSGTLPHEEFRTNWTSIAFTQPGFLHILWTNERDGVYYTDGWIDGTGWLQPQRLGAEAYWINMQSWADGEIHIFWDAGLTTRGSIHMWRSSDGVWHDAELWPIAYFSNLIRDTNGVLHIGSIESDGLDGEFMHRTWSPETGLSEPENISRKVGNIGNSTALLRLDSNGTLHAVWSHILEHRSIPDPLTGETSDVAGVFYAYQLPDGHWSKPEQVGVLAAYAHALSMELDSNDNPLIIWQNENGLVSRFKDGKSWGKVLEIVKVNPPKTPAEFGEDRWVKPTAEIKTAVNSKGKIIVGWLIPYSEFKLANWSGADWDKFVDIVSQPDGEYLLSEPSTLEMTIDNQDQIHLVFFEEQQIHYGLYTNDKVEIKPLSIFYDYYGLPEASLKVDSSGSVAVLGLPRSPSFKTKIIPEGIPSTPTSIPTAISTVEVTPTQPIQPSDNDESVRKGSINFWLPLALLLIMTLVFYKSRFWKKK